MAEKPHRWWQWFLVYPGVAVAVIGATPTYIEAFKSYSLGVPFGRSFDAQEQNRLWQENFDCAKSANFSTIVNKKKVKIGSAVCESGDVLLQGQRADWDRPQFRWVSWDQVAQHPDGEKKADLLQYFVASARAGENEADRPEPEQAPRVFSLAQAPVILCQRWVGPGQLLQRLGTPAGCWDQVINTYNGWVLGRAPAPCNQFC